MLQHVSPRVTSLGLSLIVALAGCGEGSGLTVTGAEIRELLPLRDTTAAYFTLTNHGDRPVALIGARSTVARTIEMHQTVTVDDRVSMRRITRVTIEGGETVRFEPGGLHLMVLGIDAIDATVPILLQFEDDTQTEVDFLKVAYTNAF